MIRSLEPGSGLANIPLNRCLDNTKSALGDQVLWILKTRLQSDNCED